MKVLFPIEYYPPFAIGGAEISTKLLVEGLAEKGVETYVLTPNYRSFSNVVLEEGGVHIHRFRSIRRFLLKGRGASQLSYRKRRALFYWLLGKYIRFSAREFSEKISKLHEKEDFDLIHAQNTESILGLSIAKVNRPKIAHIRDLAVFCMKRERSINGKFCKNCSQDNIRACLGANRFLASSIMKEIEWRKKLMKNFDHYVAVSKFVAGEIKKEGIARKKISVVPNPLSNDQISKLSKLKARKLLNLKKCKKVVLFVGALTKEKGAHLLPTLASKMPDKDFVIVGDGPLKHVFEKNTLENVHYHGQVPQAKVKHYYKVADVLIVPSLCPEAFGRVIAEGQVNSTPVIAFKTGGLPELITDRKTGMLVEQGNVQEMANAIARLISDEKVREKIGAEGRESALTRYGVKTIVEQVLKFYREVI